MFFSEDCIIIFIYDILNINFKPHKMLVCGFVLQPFELKINSKNGKFAELFLKLKQLPTFFAPKNCA